MMMSGVDVPAATPTVSEFIETFGAQICRALHMVTRAQTGAGPDQFAGVVAVRAANDDDHVAPLGEFRPHPAAVLSAGIPCR